MNIGRITVSDRAAAGIYEDLGGPAIEAACGDLFEGIHDYRAVVVPDDIEMVRAALIRLADEEGRELILTTGGTGLSPRDVTPESTRGVLDRELPGFGEAMRMQTFGVAPTSILSRAVAGVRGRALIINLPGRPKAIAECLGVLAPAIREAVRHLGGDHEHRG